MAGAVVLRRTAGHAEHIHLYAAVKHILPQDTICGDADLDEVRAAAEGVIADGLSAGGDGHHRHRRAFKGIGLDRGNAAGQREVRRAEEELRRELHRAVGEDDPILHTVAGDACRSAGLARRDHNGIAGSGQLGAGNADLLAGCGVDEGDGRKLAEGKTKGSMPITL